MPTVKIISEVNKYPIVVKVVPYFRYNSKKNLGRTFRISPTDITKEYLVDLGDTVKFFSLRVYSGSLNPLKIRKPIISTLPVLSSRNYVIRLYDRKSWEKPSPRVCKVHIHYQ